MPNGQAQLIANLAEDEFKTPAAASVLICKHSGAVIAGPDAKSVVIVFSVVSLECSHSLFAKPLGIAFLEECESRDGFARRKQLDLHEQNETNCCQVPVSLCRNNRWSLK